MWNSHFTEEPTITFRPSSGIFVRYIWNSFLSLYQNYTRKIFVTWVNFSFSLEHFIEKKDSAKSRSALYRALILKIIMKYRSRIRCEKVFWCLIIRKISPQSKSLLITTIDTVKTNCRNRINVKYFLQNEHLRIVCKISRVPCCVLSYFTLVFALEKFYQRLR